MARTHALRDLDRLEEAKVAGEKSITLDGEYPVHTYVDLGSVYRMFDDADHLRRALKCFEKALENYQLSGNAQPGITTNLLAHKGIFLRQLGELDDARATLEKGYELYRQTSNLQVEPEGNGTVLKLADVNFALGDVDEAFALVDEIESVCEENDATYSLLRCLDLKGWFYFQLGDYEAAAEVLERATKLASKREIVDDPKMDDLFGNPCALLALTYQALGEQELAAHAYKDVQPFTQYFVDDSLVYNYPYWVHARGILATSEDDRQRLETAEAIYNAAFVEAENGPYSEARKAAYYVLHAMIQRRQNPESLDSVIDKLQDDLEKVTEPRATYANVRDNQVPTDRWQVEAKLKELLLEADPEDEKGKALKVMRDAPQVRRDAFGDRHIQTLLAQIRLGEFVIGQDAYDFDQETYDDAISRLEKAYEQLPGSSHLRGIRRKVAGLLVDAYERKSDAAKAEHWRKTLEGLSQDGHDAAPSRVRKQETHKTKNGS